MSNASAPELRPAETLMRSLRRWASRHALLLVMGLLTVLTALVGWVSLNAVNAASQRRDAEQWHVHTLEVLLTAERFRAGAFDMLRGERGYLLTSNADFLRPYHSGRAQAEAQLRRLQMLIGDNESQRGNVTGIARQLVSFTALIDRAIELERQGRHADAVGIVRAGQGRAEFEKLQGIVDRVAEAERRLLIERRARLDALGAWNERLNYATAALVILLLVLAAVGALSALRAQRRAAAATEELRRLATFDELTGLPNRRLFMARLEEETARARRNGSALCLATLDIDHFKRINDGHGHPAGDAVLREIAAIIREKIRLGDSPARLGGEEFALLLPNTNAHQARLVCDRLRTAIAARRIALPDGTALTVTLSTGVALLTADDDLEALMRRSDEALYEAKTGGRNQVRLAA